MWHFVTCFIFFHPDITARLYVQYNKLFKNLGHYKYSSKMIQHTENCVFLEKNIRFSFSHSNRKSSRIEISENVQMYLCTVQHVYVCTRVLQAVSSRRADQLPVQRARRGHRLSRVRPRQEKRRPKIHQSYVRQLIKTIAHLWHNLFWIIVLYF